MIRVHRQVRISLTFICLLGILTGTAFADHLPVNNVDTLTNLKDPWCNVITTVSEGSDVLDQGRTRECGLSTYYSSKTKSGTIGYIDIVDLSVASKARSSVNLNIRSGPSTSYPIKGVMPQGSLSITAVWWDHTDEHWYIGTYPIDNGDDYTTGWAYGWDYLDVQPY